MKELRLPSKNNKEYVDLSEINTDYSGIIICYNDNKSTGYIQYMNNYWYYITTISGDDAAVYDNTVFELINRLKETKLCDNFKVIEF